MSHPEPITLTLDRRILEHPRAYHLRRMRAGLWLYLDLLARLPAGADSFEVEPAVVGPVLLLEVLYLVAVHRLKRDDRRTTVAQQVLWSCGVLTLRPSLQRLCWP